jgi:hypothetical protein
LCENHNVIFGDGGGNQRHAGKEPHNIEKYQRRDQSVSHKWRSLRGVLEAKFYARVAVEEGLFWLHCGNGCSFYVFETGEQIERCSYFFIVS